jgi:hypothetical protein
MVRDGAPRRAPFATASHSLGLLGRRRLLTMRDDYRSSGLTSFTLAE